MTEELVRKLSSSFNHDDLVDFCIYLLKGNRAFYIEKNKKRIKVHKKY